jgi:formylglycine-generating enzyme required for sulfatase activity
MHDLRCESWGICDDLRAALESDLIAVPAPEDGSRPFKLAAVTVTNEQFVRFINESKLPNHVGGTYLWLNDINVNLPVRWSGERYVIEAGFEEHPVVGVTWYGAAIYALALGARLPSESEWEWAACAGLPGRRYPWGNEEPTPARANFAHHVGATTPVRSYPPNDLGLYDMAGNVRQWCSDWYGARRESSVMKVVRGGAWNKGAHHLSCRVRRGKWARMGSDSCGFRLAVTR